MVHFVHWPSKSLTQWEDNERVISQYLYSGVKEKVNTIIAGSSMAFRMTIDENPYADSVYNLSLGGQGLFEGLEILKRSGKIPEHLFIESNVIYRTPRKNYAESFFMPGVYQTKRLFSGLHQEFRPITFIQYLYFGIRQKISSSKKTNANQTTKEENNKPAMLVDSVSNEKQSNLKSEHVARINSAYSKILLKTEWTSILDDLEYYLSYFEKKGTHVYFFEMPTDHLILNTNLYKHIRSSLTKKFPNIPLFKGKEMKTTDGVHLAPPVASLYLSELLKNNKNACK
jgi:hypothetical protein